MPSDSVPPLVLILGSLRCQDSDSNEKCQKSNRCRLTKQRSRSFVHFFTVAARLLMKKPHFTFSFHVNKWLKFSFSLSMLIWLSGIRIQKSLLGFEKVSELGKSWWSLKELKFDIFMVVTVSLTHCYFLEGRRETWLQTNITQHNA